MRCRPPVSRPVGRCFGRIYIARASPLSTGLSVTPVKLAVEGISLNDFFYALLRNPVLP